MQDLSERMSSWVSSRQPVRFDQYMQEHLYGECGFYTQRVRIGKDGDFTTESLNGGFAELIAMWTQENCLDSLDFLEIGGGTGDFKRNYQNHARPHRYLSVERSPMLARKQQSAGAATAQGDAAMLPFRDNSLEGVVFSYELIDALPCRTFISRKGRIKDELHVIEERGQLWHEFLPAEHDGFTELIEEYLASQSVPRTALITASPAAPHTLSEMCRVLRKGKVLLFDYTFQDKEQWNQQPFYTAHSADKRTYCGVDSMLFRPYRTDITYNPDFGFLQWLVEKNGLSARIMSRELFLSNPLEALNVGAMGVIDPRFVSLVKRSAFHSLTICI